MKQPLINKSNDDKIYENPNGNFDNLHPPNTYLKNRLSLNYDYQMYITQTPPKSLYLNVPVNNFHQTNIQINSNYSIHPQYQSNYFNNNCVHHLVRTLPATDRKYYKNYCYVKCPNVTTVWIDSEGFSYLTSYSNDQNYFFCPRNDNGFNIKTWTEQKTNNKITLEKLNEFILQLNNEFKISDNIKIAKKTINKECIIYFFLALVSLIFFIICFGTWMNLFTEYICINDRMRFLSFFGWIFTGIFCLISLLLICIYSFRDNNHLVDKIFLKNTGLQNFFDNWNNQYFLPCGLYVMAPRNLCYLQFVLDKNIKFSLQDHSFPYDMI